MNFIITESQIRNLVESQKTPKLTEYIKSMYSFSSDILEKTSKKYDLNLKSLMKMGANIGGLILPASKFIKEKNEKLTEFQVSLILTGIICIHFTNDNTIINKIVKKIKDEGLTDIFLETKKKIDLLKSSFRDFLKSLNIMDNNTNILSYTFLIPIIMDLNNILSKDLDKSSNLVVNQILNSGVIDISEKKLDSVIKQILKRIS